MRYEMQNFIKFSKRQSCKNSGTVASNVGQKPKRDDWKRERKIARLQKQKQRKVAG